MYASVKATNPVLQCGTVHTCVYFQGLVEGDLNKFALELHNTNDVL